MRRTDTRTITYLSIFGKARALQHINIRELGKPYQEDPHPQDTEEFKRACYQFVSFPSIPNIDGRDEHNLDRMVTIILKVLSSEQFNSGQGSIRSLFSPSAAVFPRDSSCPIASKPPLSCRVFSVKAII